MSLISHRAAIRLFVATIIAAIIPFDSMFLSAQLTTEDHRDLIVELLEPNVFRQRIKSVYDMDTDSSECEGLVDEGERGDCFLLRALQLLDADASELALQDLKKSAQLNNSYAKVKLGEISLLSDQPGNIDTAIDWYKEAAHAGNPVAEYMLARLGLIFPERIEKTDEYLVQLVKRSADQDIVPAIKFLGDISRDGLFGISKEKNQAFELYITAADKGYAPAQYEVAIQCIEAGRINEAISWLEKSASTGFAPAHYKLGLYYWDQSEIHSEAASDAVFHLKEAYGAGITESALSLGTAYLMGRGAQQDYDRARFLFNEILGSSEGFAESFLGQMYARGLGVDKNMELACSYFRDSALADNPHGKYGYGICLRAQGEIDEGMKWIREAADQGLDRAQQFLEDGK